MEVLISAVLGDLVGRAISALVKKCHEQITTEEDLERLRQLLLRIHGIVHEADGRLVTNRVMIYQVSTMREQMFRGYYLFDAFRCRERKTEGVSGRLFAQSKFNPAKRFRHISSSTQIENMVFGRESSELKELILGLETMIADLKEFAIFLMSYPRLFHQPYSAYLFLDKCMFGRQMEREQAISFLLQAEPLGNRNLGVLPIVGPALVGKSTLVEHVCDDERVRNHFSLILLFSGNNLNYETVTTFRDRCVIKHQNFAFDEERSLVVLELLGEVDEGAWKRLMHTSKRFMTHGSKIIITSRSENTASLGTTEAIKLNCLSKEAYWYFFRMLVFGSTNPEEHPKLTSIAMEIALEMGGSFIFAHVVGALLRANLSTSFWCRVLRHVREHVQKNTLLFGEYPDEEQPRYMWSMAKTRRGSKELKFLLLHDSYQKQPGFRGMVPRITVADLLSGTWNTIPQGKFEVLSWRSRIPPYYSYTYDCEFVRHKSTTPSHREK